MRIVCVEVVNFRGIKQLSWHPAPGTNCLVGPGDSGKTTVLDAIELAFAPRNGVTFDDTDFYAVDPKANPIAITVTVADLPTEFLKEDKYGHYLQGWDDTAKRLEDEPDEARGLEDVLSVKLTVDHTLEGEWTLFNQRVAQGGQSSRALGFQDRQDIAPSRLGPYADRHLGWGRQSVLNRVTKGSTASRGLMAEAGRVARQEFSKDSQSLFADTIKEAKLAAQRLGVPVGDRLHAMLDVQAMGLSSGGISLHDGDLPLRRLGVGSSRLFTAALQDYARAKASVALIDEVEHGLEPHRISRLLRELKKEKADGKTKAQVFMTTHSPVVLQELSVDELNVVRRHSKSGAATIVPANTPYPGLDVQSQPRANPQAYLAPTILVCEGKTEVGFVRGLDDFWVSKGRLPLSTAGVVPVSGGGVDKAPVIAGYFHSLGYRVGLLLDSDRDPEDANVLNRLRSAGVNVFRWAQGHATEDHLFRDLPLASIINLIRAAAATQADEQSILDRLNRKLPAKKFAIFSDIEKAANERDVRIALGELAKGREKNDKRERERERGWFKDISIAEWIGRKLVGPHLDELKGKFSETIIEVRTWVDREQ
ncbi:energy-coupling factor transporter ATP-binding protein EcfA2 [Bradyrhizobium japonicum]|uniref:ATP-dependent nuclease n=1 Tax=Bradyrhizobium japonicum TaxID=375 RepID=UPI002225B9F6|nr:ATP-binding protein [Bradyrhizobium japonicum]MCW2225714.1 energy-coupling factor transporter ATP-binding protein EcfA2 [Bradyrhizobium japonicum]MCW2340926.1 energy-coupling factor transporter ATP-binding protein EcfA2 [Bradyrhizobium japonicum]